MINLKYGSPNLDEYLTNARVIAKHVENRSFSEITKQINTGFFGGGIFEPKKFKSLFDLYVPHDNGRTCINMYDNSLCVELYKKKSWGALSGFVEGIPLIGSALAIIAALGHMYAIGHLLLIEGC